MAPKMTSAISARSCRKRRLSRRRDRHAAAAAAFTLVEMLTVIGILVILMAFAVPALIRVFRSGKAAIASANLQVISTGLDAYKQDYGDYPRVDTPYTGFAVLGKALVAPYGDGVDNTSSATPQPVDSKDPPPYSGGTQYHMGDVVRQPMALPAAGTINTYVALKDTTASPTTTTDWAPFPVNDYKDGAGTRVRPGGDPRGPYIPPDKVHMRGLAILDAQDNPILYFPAATVKPNLNQAPAAAQQPPYVGYLSKQSLFDAQDNIVPFLHGSDTLAQPTNGLRAIRSVLGDFNPHDDSASTNCDGTIQPTAGESAVAAGVNYILWSAGADGVYGPPYHDPPPQFPTKFDLGKCDDATNFK
jgi:type II secretory pathway pseudopilin PulG